MISDILKILSVLFKLLVKGIAYVLKGISWYFVNIDKIFKSYPRKENKTISIKEEIL